MAAMVPPPLAPLHTSISQHDVQQVYVIKTRKYYCFYHMLCDKSMSLKLENIIVFTIY
jgi:hypothetical protein